MSAVAALAPRDAKGAPISAHRRSMIGKLHVAKAQLRMAEDDYRALLLRVTGKMSAADATDAGLSAALAEMQRLGFKPLPSRGGRHRLRADSKLARKARALWISLHQLGVVRNPDDKALEAFGKRQLKVDKLQWADESQGYRLVEALKAMAEGAGWSQSLAGVAPEHRAQVLKVSLVRAQIAKLQAAGAVAAQLTPEEAITRLCGEELRMDRLAWAPIEQLELIAVTLGAKVRELGA